MDAKSKARLAVLRGGQRVSVQDDMDEDDGVKVGGAAPSPGPDQSPAQIKKALSRVGAVRGR